MITFKFNVTRNTEVSEVSIRADDQEIAWLKLVADIDMTEVDKIVLVTIAG